MLSEYKNYKIRFFRHLLIPKICTDVENVIFFKSKKDINLLGVLFVVIFLAVNLEVTKLVRFLVFGNYTKPVTQLVLLQVLLCQVLEVPI